MKLLPPPIDSLLRERERENRVPGMGAREEEERGGGGGGERDRVHTREVKLDGDRVGMLFGCNSQNFNNSGIC